MVKPICPIKIFKKAMNPITYKFPPRIATETQGHDALNDFYHFCLQYSDCTINLDWQEMKYMEANLSALLLCMGWKLKQERKLCFFLSETQINGHLNVFLRNGLANWFLGKTDACVDERESTISAKAFKLDSVDDFVSYITQDLMSHRGVRQVHFADKQRVQESYFEIFSNVQQHARTTEPILACGQFFPQQQELKFTLVDMGCGFLKNVSEFTQDSIKPITLPSDAISWAVKGNSTKTEAVGGTGLSKILTYCMKNNGGLHIISDGCYWAFDKGILNTSRLKRCFSGTTIHLIFRST